MPIGVINQAWLSLLGFYQGEHCHFKVREHCVAYFCLHFPLFSFTWIFQQLWVYTKLKFVLKNRSSRLFFWWGLQDWGTSGGGKLGHSFSMRRIACMSYSPISCLLCPWPHSSGKRIFISCQRGPWCPETALIRPDYHLHNLSRSLSVCYQSREIHSKPEWLSQL